MQERRYLNAHFPASDCQWNYPTGVKHILCSRLRIARKTIEYRMYHGELFSFSLRPPKPDYEIGFCEWEGGEEKTVQWNRMIRKVEKMGRILSDSSRTTHNQTNSLQRGARPERRKVKGTHCDSILDSFRGHLFSSKRSHLICISGLFYYHTIISYVDKFKVKGFYFLASLRRRHLICLLTRLTYTVLILPRIGVTFLRIRLDPFRGVNWQAEG